MAAVGEIREIDHFDQLKNSREKEIQILRQQNKILSEKCNLVFILF